MKDAETHEHLASHAAGVINICNKSYLNESSFVKTVLASGSVVCSISFQFNQIFIWPAVAHFLIHM